MAEGDDRKAAEDASLQNGDREPAPVVSNDEGKQTAREQQSHIVKQSLLERVGLFAPKDKPDPYAHRRGEPRSFIALWILYVVGAIFLTLATLGVRGFVQVDVYRVGLVRLMIVLMAGVVLVWPMVRLSQRGPHRVVLSFLMDACIVLVPLVGVILPQAMPWMEVWNLDAALCSGLWCFAWGLFAAGILINVFAKSEMPSQGARMAGAAVLAGVCVLPALYVPFMSPRSVGAGSELNYNGWLLVSPVAGLFDMLRDRSWSGTAVRVSAEHWRAGWIALGLACALVGVGAVRGRGTGSTASLR